MNNIDSRSRVFNERLASAERKWEFRYENQKKTIRELEKSVKDLRNRNKNLREKLND